MPNTEGALAVPRTVGGPIFKQLRAEECWRLVGDHILGRVAFADGEKVHIAPASYRLRGHTLYFRTSAFGPVARHALHRTTSVQVDDIDPEGFDGWSVTMTGSAHQVADAATLATLWSPSRPHPWSAGHKSVWIALDVKQIDGQRAISPS